MSQHPATQFFDLDFAIVVVLLLREAGSYLLFQNQ